MDRTFRKYITEKRVNMGIKNVIPTMIVKAEVSSSDILITFRLATVTKINNSLIIALIIQHSAISTGSIPLFIFKMKREIATIMKKIRTKLVSPVLCYFVDLSM